MPLRVAKRRRADTVSYRGTNGKTTNASVIGEQPATPTLNVPTTNTTGGTLATGITISYRLAVVINGAESLGSTAQSVVTGAGSTNVGILTWPAVTGAGAFRVYGRTAGTQLFMIEVSGATLGWTDTGAVTPAGALPVAGELGLLISTKRSGLRLRSVPKATAVKQTDVYYLR